MLRGGRRRLGRFFTRNGRAPHSRNFEAAALPRPRRRRLERHRRGRGRRFRRRAGAPRRDGEDVRAGDARAAAAARRRPPSWPSSRRALRGRGGPFRAAVRPADGAARLAGARGAPRAAAGVWRGGAAAEPAARARRRRADAARVGAARGVVAVVGLFLCVTVSRPSPGASYHAWRRGSTRPRWDQESHRRWLALGEKLPCRLCEARGWRRTGSEGLPGCAARESYSLGGESRRSA